jgi:hypothetical protein
MNAGGVDKACKSNENHCDYINVLLVADEVVTRRYVPSSQG